MKILIVRFNDQPAVNIVENIQKYSKYNCDITTRNDLNICNRADVVFYYNVNDLFQPIVFNMLKKTQQPICTGIQSWRLIFEPEWVSKINLLNIKGICSPSKKILDAALKIVNVSIGVVTPFSADTGLFKEKIRINPESVLRVGYVGTFREDKRYNEVVKPAFDIVKNNVHLIIFGKASGKRLSHSEMVNAYNNMDCIVCGSKFESGPMPLIEAGLCGRPAITTRCGMTEDIFNDITSIFIDGDYRSLVDAINVFIKNKGICIRKGQMSKDRIIKSWSWDNLITYQDKFFEEVFNVG